MSFSPKKTTALVLLGVLMWQLVATVAFAATDWTQNNWGGGPGQTAWSDPTRFLSETNIDYSFPIAITLEEGPPPDWFSPDWQYRMEITVDPDEVPGTDPLPNYPLLVSLGVNSELAESAQDDAADIVFTDADGVTELNYEIESYVTDDGTLNAWVSVPSLSATTPTSIYMYYGNPDGSQTPGNNVETVWADYGLVMHMNQDSGQFLDSTANSNDTTTAVVDDRVQGQVNGAIQTTDSVGQLTIPSNANSSLSVTSDFTISFWVNPASGGGGFQQVIQKSTDGNDPNNYGIYINFNDIFVSWFNGGFRQFQAFGVVDYDQWNYITYRRTGSLAGANLTQYIYVDGALANSNSITLPDQELLPNTETLLMVRQPSGFPVRGMLDEVRISQIPLTPEYIQTEFNNQNDPGGFVTFGSEEEYEPVYPSSGNLISSIFDTTGPSTWEDFSAVMTISPDTDIEIKARTGNDSNLADAPDFSSCTPLTSGSIVNACIQDGDRYIQYQATLLTTDPTESPTLEGVTFSYTTVSPSPAPPFPGGSSFSAPGPASAPTCSIPTPIGQANLFQINRTGTTAQLFFTPVNDYTANYHVMYGFNQGTPLFGALSAPVTSQTNNGVQSIMINDLDPNTGYWFVIAPVNGCAVGTWSNWLQAGPTRGRGLIFYQYLPNAIKQML